MVHSLNCVHGKVCDGITSASSLALTLIIWFQLERVTANLAQEKHAIEETCRLMILQNELKEKIERSKEDMQCMNALLEKQKLERAQYVLICLKHFWSLSVLLTCFTDPRNSMKPPFCHISIKVSKNDLAAEWIEQMLHRKHGLRKRSRNKMRDIPCWRRSERSGISVKKRYTECHKASELIRCYTGTFPVDTATFLAITWNPLWVLRPLWFFCYVAASKKHSIQRTGWNCWSTEGVSCSISIELSVLLNAWGAALWSHISILKDLMCDWKGLIIDVHRALHCSLVGHNG